MLLSGVFSSEVAPEVAMRSFRRVLVIAVVVVGVGGCATRYQEMGATGGVSAAPITDDLWRISARGNLYTEATTIQDHVLLKAAETTLAAGRTHFVIVGKEGRGARGLSSPAAFGGGVEQSNYGLLAAGRRGPSEDLMIRLLPTNASTEDRAEALEASRLVANIGPRVKKPEP